MKQWHNEPDIMEMAGAQRFRGEWTLKTEKKTDSRKEWRWIVEQANGLLGCSATVYMYSNLITYKRQINVNMAELLKFKMTDSNENCPSFALVFYLTIWANKTNN